MPREYHREYARNYYQEKMAAFVKQLGSKCVKCGSTNDLHFDHIEPKTKKFSIACFNSYSKEATQKELKKCQLLCEPCHVKKSKKDGSTLQGSKRPNYILTERDVIKIKQGLAQGKTGRELAKTFGCSDVNISLIKNKKAWAHL